MAPGLRRLLVTLLALLCLFTIGAGAVVTRLLPRRLAEWDIPRVAARPAATPGQVLSPAVGLAGDGGSSQSRSSRPSGSARGSSQAAGATAAGLARVLQPILGAASLGPHVGIEVADLATGQVLYGRNSGVAFTPASTTKLATAIAALQVLGPDARFTTRVVAGPGRSSIVLIGGGDPTLAAGRPPATDYPQPATLLSLAAATARQLRADGRRSVRLSYDTSLFTGPQFAPGWSANYVTTGNVTPISALEVDQGRLTASGAPQDADDPDNYRPRTFQPAAEAAAAFARFLRADGITVLGTPAVGSAPRHAASIASVSSPPLAEIVQWMLTESNNVIAENLARHVAIATGHPASFSGAAAAEELTLRRLGVRSGVSLVDGSGLSPDDRITPAALIKLIGLAAAPAHPGLRAAITGLPVAGFSGTLSAGQSVFPVAGPPGLGVVRAKTGNLATVAALAGIAYARNGELLSFVVMADQVRASNLVPAATKMVGLATALAGCGCH
jgi:D-alanyl-D-alanine carboxypeptidase/D-alanyl-D-alanine-endopeptidase (penicillin-binding protein 4)